MCNQRCPQHGARCQSNPTPTDPHPLRAHGDPKGDPLHICLKGGAHAFTPLDPELRVEESLGGNGHE